MVYFFKKKKITNSETIVRFILVVAIKGKIRREDRMPLKQNKIQAKQPKPYADLMALYAAMLVQLSLWIGIGKWQ